METASRVAEFRDAELAYHGKHGRYLPLDSERITLRSAVVGTQRGTWTPGPALERLGWTPPGPQRGPCWVEVNDQVLLVNGICDLDGDGAFARFSVTGNAVVEHLTDDNIY